MAGVGDLGFMQRGRRFLIGLVMLGVGGMIGYAIPKSNAAPKAETGTISAVDNATAHAGILFRIKVHQAGDPEQFRWQDGTPWRDKAGRWHDKGTPGCLVPGTATGARITVGVVDAQSASNAPARTVVVWVKCYR